MKTINEKVSTDRMKTELNKYQFYGSIAECARAAAPVFKKNRWEWFVIGIPNEAQIADTLRHLEKSAKKTGDDNAQSGRLVYHAGRFGHLKS